MDRENPENDAGVGYLSFRSPSENNSQRRVADIGALSGRRKRCVCASFPGVIHTANDLDGTVVMNIFMTNQHSR